MPRPGSVFIALCMSVIAAGAAAIAYLVFGWEAGASGAFGLAVFTALAVGALSAEAARERAFTRARLAEISRAKDDLARELGDIARRVDRFETIAMDKAKAATQPIAEEIDALGELVHQFAETLDAHEKAIGRAVAAAPVAAPVLAPQIAQPQILQPQILQPQIQQSTAQPIPQAIAAQPVPPPAPSRTSSAPQAPAPPPAPTAAEIAPEAGAVALIAEAIGARSFDLYLQPIVTLPQRKVRWYETSLRLRTDDGGALAPAAYLRLAEGAGLRPALDRAAIEQALQVVRRLSGRNREVGLTVPVGAATLADPAFATRALPLLDASRGLSASLLIGVTQEALRRVTPIETASMAAMTALGYRFVVTDVGDFALEPRDLSERGVKQVHAPAALMLGRAVASEIHPADLAGLFARYGVDLVVTDVTTEAEVLDLLDFDVRYGKGDLFSPPRPVRADVLSGGEAAEPARAPRAPTARVTPETLGAAALANGALGAGGSPGQRKPPVGSAALRALARNRS